VVEPSGPHSRDPAHGRLSGSRSGRPARRAEGPFHASFVIARVAGIEIGANWSWLIVVWLIVASLGSSVFPDEVPGLSDGAYAAMAVIATLLFFVSLVLHELGHALVAQREGMQISGITLWLFGGVARFEGMFPSAGAELRIALAGPAVTLVLAGLFLGGAEALSLPDAVDEVVTWLGRINLILLGFNMLPALPLDGGRVLRAILWRTTGNFTRATRTAGALGRAFGNVLVALGLFTLLFAGAVGGLWFIVLGFFLSAAAQAEASLATTRAALAGLRVRDAMVRRPETVPGDLTVAAFLEGPFSHTRHAAYPVVADTTVGLLSYRDVARVRPERREHTRVAELAVPASEGLVLAPDEELADAAMALAETRPERALVLENGRLAGLLSMTDVARLLEVRHPPR
jgi:Zn-dependent protease/CBS domain-containing protein